VSSQCGYLPFAPSAPALPDQCIRRVAEFRCLGFAGAWDKHSPPKRLRNASAGGNVWEAESDIDWLDLVSTPAAADWDASFTVERINL
jgi:hypothetical protein